MNSEATAPGSGYSAGKNGGGGGVNAVKFGIRNTPDSNQFLCIFSIDCQNSTGGFIVVNLTLLEGDSMVIIPVPFRHTVNPEKH